MGTIPPGGSEPPKDAGANERRAALRRSVVDSHLITVDLAFQSGALLLDLSETGMGVQALGSVPSGTATPLHFDLPETGGRIVGVGRIAWTDTSGRLGIRFEEIGEVSRLHLAQWLARDRRPLLAPGPNMTIPAWPPAHARDEIAALRRELTTERLTGDAALAFVVERLRSVTRATGAAIALEEGGEIVCRASSGNAPGIGARVDPSSGLSGECVRTGEIVRCEDTETDPRADRLVCRRLELRSIVIVPVRLQGRPAGVLEVFSSRAHAFESSDVLLLRRLSDLVAGIAVRQPEPAPSSAPRPQTVMAAALMQPCLEGLPAADSTPTMLEEILTLELEEQPYLPPPAPARLQATLKPPVEAEAVGQAQRAPVMEAPAPRRQPAVVEAAPVVAATVSIPPIERPAPPPAPRTRPVVVEAAPVAASTVSIPSTERPAPPPAPPPAPRTHPVVVESAPVAAPTVSTPPIERPAPPPAPRTHPVVVEPAPVAAPTVSTPPIERPAPPPAPRTHPVVVEAPPVAASTVSIPSIERPAPPPPASAQAVKPEVKAEPRPIAARSTVPVEERVAPKQVSVAAVSSVPATVSTPVAPLESVTSPLPVRAPDFVKSRAMSAAAQAPVRPIPAPVRDQDQKSTDNRPSSSAAIEAVLPSLATQRPSPWRLRITGGAILVAVLVVGGWQVWRAIAPPRGTPMDSEVKQGQATAPPTLNPPAPAIEASATPAPVPENAVPLVAKPSAPPPANTATRPRPAEVVTEPANPPAAEEEIPAVQILEPIPLRRPVVAEVEAPSAISIAPRTPSEASAISKLLHAPIATPTLDARVSHISGGKLLKKVDPVYSSGAMRMTGQVVLKATISREGTVTAVHIVSGQAMLAQAAAAAVKRWRYEPFLLNGVPIEVENTILVNFKAPGQE